jgi:hypothetical protein
MSMKTILTFLFLIKMPFELFSQEVKVYNLRNCQSELRTVTFDGQLSTLNWWVIRKTKLKDQKVLQFSPSYKLDSSWLINQIEKLRKTLPSSYFQPHSFMSDWYNNYPDEPAIWFLQVYAYKDKSEKFHPLAAFKVVFDGDDARVDAYRRSATIKNIIFIFDKAELAKIALKLQSNHTIY